MDYTFILSPVAILISAFGAWKYAGKAIRSNEEIAKKRATFDYISKLSWDQDYIAAKNRFLALRAGSKKLRAIAEEYEDSKKAKDVEDNELTQIISDHSAIKNILNEYEAMAIAISAGALDGEMLRSNIRQQFITHVDACSEFIEYTRKCSGVREPEKLWCELQDLRDHWSKNT